MKTHVANFRIHGELNDFLAAGDRGKPVDLCFKGNPAIKDPIETIGIPHCEVDLVLVGRQSVDFTYRLQRHDRVAVYPRCEDMEGPELQHLLPPPLLTPGFMVDVNLGKLAKRLRMLGFDTAYENHLDDGEIVARALEERRMILTRDRRLLFRRVVSHGYWVRSVEPEQQAIEVLRRFDLVNRIRPWRRCIECNGRVESADRERVWSRLEPLTRRYYREFHRCPECGRTYWQGSHVDHMKSLIHRITSGARQDRAAAPHGSWKSRHPSG